jgi:hypothetical protein
MTGTANRCDGTSLRIHMTNLSYDGCCLLTEDPLDIGETIELVMPGMQRVNVMVRWVKENKAGVRFVKTGSVVDERRSRIGV